MNAQLIEEQETFFEMFDTWTEALPVPEDYCLDTDVDDFIIDKIKEAYTNLSKSYMNDEDFKQGIKYYFSDDPETL